MELDNSLTFLFWLAVFYAPSLTYALFTREKPTTLQDKRVDMFAMNTAMAFLFCLVFPPWGFIGGWVWCWGFVASEWM